MDQTRTAPPPALPRPLFVFALLYGGMTVLAGVLGFKQIALPLGFTTLAVESGIFAFLMLVAISSAIAQVYGSAIANRLVLWGFAPLGLSILLIQVVLALPPSPQMPVENLAAFETVLSQTGRIMIAGPIAYGVSLFLNVWLFERLRGQNTEGRGNGGGFWMMLRGGFASAISQAVDTLIFITVAFYGQFDIVPLLIGQAIAKVVLSFVFVPLIIWVLVRLAGDGTRELAAR
ncbi:queuosine precursor transporter [Alteriqipengyuania sp. 357]